MSHSRRRRFRERLPLLLSIAALVVAVLGTTPLGEAAMEALPRSSVGTAQLKPNSVTSAKVRNGTLQRDDFRLGAFPTAGAAGPTGDKGDKGDPGPKGDKGEAGPRTPSWGDVTGPSFGAGDLSSWKDLGSKLTLAPVGGKSARYFVFGRISAEVTCSSGGACEQLYALFVNGNVVQQTNARVSGPAGQRARDNISMFGIATVSRATRLVNDPVLSLRYRNGSNVAESSVAISLGAIALG